MKRIISFVVVLVMAFSLFAIYASAEEITIGVSIWSSTDTLGSEVKRLLDSAAETLGVKVIYVDQ
jgi:ribose transport system substrate-binding protein